MDVELRHLRYFLAVADELHFGRAAELLHIAQPALSQQIRKLEHALGADLLLRTSRSVALTPAGEVLQARARALLEQAARDLAEVVGVGRGEQGRLDIGFVNSALPLGAIDRIQQFRDRYPLVQVHIQEGYTSSLTAQVARGALDVALVRDPDPQPGVQTTVLVSEPFMGVVPIDHPLADQQHLTGAQLAAEPLVFFPPAAGRYAYARNLESVTETGAPPLIYQEASNWMTILHLVGAGLGVTIAPRSATLTAPQHVRTLPLVGTSARSSLHLATRVGDRRALVRNFCDLPGAETVDLDRMVRSGAGQRGSEPPATT